MSQTILDPIQEQDSTTQGRWSVLIFNNEHTAYETVIRVLMFATGCTQNEAELETWEAHHMGKAHVHFDERETCERIAGIIERVGVTATVQLEWE